VQKLPFIPLDSEAEQLVAASHVVEAEANTVFAVCYCGRRTRLGGTVNNTLGVETKKQLKAWAVGSR
jgi:hypothetical protein